MDKSKIIAVGTASAVIGLGLGYGLAPENIVEVPGETKIVTETVEVPVEVPVETIKEVEVIKEVNVTKEVLVDNGKLDEVLTHIYDNDGSVEYIIDDLDDDEVYLIADRVVLVNELKKLAVDVVKSELIDEVDKMVVSDVELDEDDVERLRIDDDLDEISINDIDFDDKDATVVVTGTFEHDDIDYEYSVDVIFKGGEFDELTNIQIVEE